jgi:hypothetical protein
MKTLKPMSDQHIDSWAKYFRFWYFHETMTFESFLHCVEAGEVPRRRNADWSKVERQS